MKNLILAFILSTSFSAYGQSQTGTGSGGVAGGGFQASGSSGGGGIQLTDKPGSSSGGGFQRSFNDFFEMPEGVTYKLEDGKLVIDLNKTEVLDLMTDKGEVLDIEQLKNDIQNIHASREGGSQSGGN